MEWNKFVRWLDEMELLHTVELIRMWKGPHHTLLNGLGVLFKPALYLGGGCRGFLENQGEEQGNIESK